MVYVDFMKQECSGILWRFWIKLPGRREFPASGCGAGYLAGVMCFLKLPELQIFYKIPSELSQSLFGVLTDKRVVLINHPQHESIDH
jgi:hypothetical protein